jgi:sterol desaturase/sphingolipid hydroxylase (fatty acid hydroxylase superfamily)
MDGKAIALAIPFFLLLIAIEIAVDRRRQKRGLEPLYRFGDSITSLACGVGQQMLAVVAVGALGIGAYAAIHGKVGLVAMSASSPAVWLFAFVGVDLCYYAYHRASHRINFFWATHVVHHQSEEYILSTALRQSWFTGLTSWVFYAPLAVLGVPTSVFVMCLTLNTLYQFWIHTRAIDKLGAFERVMNTPSHHRIHHAIDPEYIDKNYAGVFIVWDRLFGTFIEESAEPSYGTVKPLASYNAFWANFEGFARLVHMSRSTSRLADKLLVWVMPPEWQPDDLGGPVVVPPVEAGRTKYDVPSNRPLFQYVAAQFVGVATLVFGILWYADVLPASDQTALAGVTIVTLATWGALLERRRWGVPLELARLGLLGLALVWVFRASDAVAWVVVGWAALALGSGAALLRALRLGPARVDAVADPG